MSDALPVIPRTPPATATALNRREFLAGAAVGVVGTAATFYGLNIPDWFRDLQPTQAPIAPQSPHLAMPGLFPGRVIEVHHAEAVTSEQKKLYEEWGKPHFYTPRNREVVKTLMNRGLRDLVGSEDAVQAWRHFFQPGDRVGIKVVPVGRPNSISSHEVVLECIDGLRSAGVEFSDIIVFDRYMNEFVSCQYPDILPDGVHWECASVQYDDLQVELDGQMPNAPFEKHVSGYDRDVYRELPFCSPQHDAKDDRRYRSHLCNIVSKKVDKFISLPVLKDHRSSGVTLSLKNLSHGLVNNVSRSHLHTNPKNVREIGATMNQCGTFIPAMVSLPTIREKAVLQILDGLVGTYEGGPGNWNRSFTTWNHNSLFFATDPVACDRIGWEIVDAKRAEMGWPAVASMGLNASTGQELQGRPIHEAFHIRQPEHISLAATLGLGQFERDKLDHQRIELA